MSRAVTISRYAADDRRGPAHRSPFRSRAEQTRYTAALQMITKRSEELTGLEVIAEHTNDPRTRRVLAQRIKATRNNLASWEAYIRNCDREPGAVVHPTPQRRKS